MSYTSFELANGRRIAGEQPSEQEMRLIAETNELFNLWVKPKPRQGGSTMNPNDILRPAPDTTSADPETVRAKLLDMETVGFVAEFDPDEAEMAGAFVEDALSDADAMASVIDRTDCIERTQWRKPAPPSTANDSDFNPTVDVF